MNAERVLVRSLQPTGEAARHLQSASRVIIHTAQHHLCSMLYV